MGVRALRLAFITPVALAALVIQHNASIGAAHAVHNGQSTRPLVNIAAFRGQGKLAFVWGGKPRQFGVVPDGRLYVLDGQAKRLRQLTRSADTAAPTWSPDGRWLAYAVVTINGYNEDRRLWLTHADGSSMHPVHGVAGHAGGGISVSVAFAWSPVSDLLAAVPANGVGLWLVPPRGQPRNLTPAGMRVSSFAWSPNGRMLAFVGSMPKRREWLYTVPISGGAPTRRVGPPPQQLACLWVATWWPDGKGLLYWLDPQCSASIAADGLNLFTLPLTGAKPRLLTQTLAYTDWLSWSPSGDRLLLVAGEAREEDQNKVLAVCEVKRALCRALPQPGGGVSLDPAWSPDGKQIAFVHASSSVPVTGVDYAAWLRTRGLWIMGVNGSAPHELRAARTGVYDPQWSHNGQHLLYMQDSAIWLISTNGGKPVRIVYPYPDPTRQPTFYYGHVWWGNDFDWYQSAAR